MKRRLLIVAIFLLAGAVVNVAVAWGCVLPGWWVSLRFRSHLPLTEEFSQLVTRIPTNKAGEMWVPLDNSGWDDAGVVASGSDVVSHAHGSHSRTVSSGIGVRREQKTAGTTRDGVLSLNPFDNITVYTWRAGLPMRSLKGHCAVGRGIVWPHGVWLFSRKILYVLPFHPIWPGFAFNTVFYAAFLWLLICGPFALRRLVRVRRGLCPACAYPRGESDVCSECGKPLLGRARVTT